MTEFVVLFYQNSISGISVWFHYFLVLFLADYVYFALSQSKLEIMFGVRLPKQCPIYKSVVALRLFDMQGESATSLLRCVQALNRVLLFCLCKEFREMRAASKYFGVHMQGSYRFNF